MKTYFRFIHIIIKKQFHSRLFWGLLFLFPLCIWIASLCATPEDEQIAVALYFEPSSEQSITGPSQSDFAAQVQSKLLSNSDSLFSFYAYNNEEDLRQDVVTGKAECGYVFPNTLLKRLDQGNADRQITVYQASSSTIAPIIEEVVYAALFEVYSGHLLEAFLMQDSQLSKEQIQSSEKYYHTHLQDGSVFQFSYDYLGEQTLISQNNAYKKTSYVLAPLRGFIALLVYLSGFCGLLTFYFDKKNQIFVRTSYHQESIYRLLEILIPVLFISIIGIITVYASGLQTMDNGILLLGKELSGMLLLVTLTVASCYLLSYLLFHEYLICACIPVVILGCLIATPVIIDFSQFIPLIRNLRYLFVPFYYLRLF